MPEPPFLFQNLRVDQQALTLANRISSLTSGFRRPNWHLADQMNRASLSIALNIAESTGRATVADRRRFLLMARGSVHECVALLDMCEKKQLLADSERADLNQGFVMVAKMLAGMIRYADDVDSARDETEAYGEP